MISAFFKMISIPCFSLTPIFASADNVNIDPCKLNDVVRIQRPIDPEDPSSPNFNYAFRFIQNGDPRLPVVIFLPGGPGDTSIKGGPSKLLGFNSITTDPRGVGCNKESE